MSDLNIHSKNYKNNNDSCLRLMTWNIQGLTNDTILDDYFVNIVNNNDIVVLTETWLSEQVQVLNSSFYNYHNLRPMHARARGPSGGISMLIRHTLRNNDKHKTAHQNLIFLFG